MRLKYSFETMELDDRIVAVPVGEGAREFRGVIKLNEVAAAVFELLKEETDEDTITNTLVAEFDADYSTLANDVHKCIEMFSEKGLFV